MYISKLFLNKNKITNLKRKYGRNNEGKITVRYRKKGHKRLIRFVNDNLKLDKNFIVISIEYNPYKNKFLNLVYNKKKNTIEHRYYEINNQTNVLDVLKSNNNINSLVSQPNNNITKIEKLSIGDIICNIEKFPGKGPIFARSAGTFGQLIKFDNSNKNLAQVRLPSKEQYFIDKNCFCVKGKNSNIFHKQLKKWKAGSSSNLGVKSKVRGVAKNPVDHPHGGGEGKGYIGRAPVNPQGKLTKGVPTRKLKKNSFFIALKRSKLN